MIKASLPADEKLRLKALDEYDVLDSEAEKIFDDLTELASEICETPISLISLIDPDRQWFKSKVGLGVEETPRDLAFCAHAILQQELFEVSDASQDERFYDNPLVTNSPNIRFYAGTQLQTPTGHNIGTLCVISDKPKKLTIQQRKALEILGREVIAQLELRIRNKNLELSNKYKTEFLANISHEIRTPLNAIVGLSELSLAHPNATNIDQEIYSYLQQINFSGNNLLGIINSVLDLSKIEAAKMELNESSCDVKALLENTVNVLRYRAEEKRIELRTQITDIRPDCILLDQQKLTQILTNIITNAIKFTSNDKEIKIRVWSQSDVLHIEVEDQGIGISEKDLKTLFNKYAQVSKKKTTQEGTGLGLSITKGLVELMGGNIVMTSVEKVGTSVNVSLPFQYAECDHSRDKDVSSPVLPENIKVLIVEDNKVNQAVISAMMDKLGINFDIIDEGEDALPMLLSSYYDLVLMDINLPGINGIEATQQLKEQGIMTPIVALTADVFRTNKEKSLFDGFLTKPIQLACLEREITLVVNT